MYDNKNYDIVSDEEIISSDEEDYDHMNNTSGLQSRNQHSVLHSIWNIVNPDNLRLKDYIFDNKEETVFSGDEEDYSINSDVLTTEVNTNQTHSRRLKTERQCSWTEQIQCSSIGFFWLLFRILLKLIKFIKNIILFFSFLFVVAANFPFAVMKNFILFLKRYTKSPCIHYIPVNLIPSIINHFSQFIQTSFLCRHKVPMQRCNSAPLNTSNSNRYKESTISESSSSDHYNNNHFFLYIILGLGLLGYLTYCYSHPTTKICKVQLAFNNLKIKLIEHSHGIYMLPGEDCMRAGRCCRGYLEGAFRWMSCFITIPIRVLLIAWPKPPSEVDPHVDGLNGIRHYIDKIAEDLNIKKDDINNEEEGLYLIQTNVINLEQNLNEKANSINKLKPKLEKSTELIQKMKTEIQNSMNDLKKIINIRNDADKMIDIIRMESQDSSNFVKGSLSRMHASLEAEQIRLQTQISNIENLIKEDNTKSGERNRRLLQRIQNEIDNIKDVQRDIKKRIFPLSNIQTIFKEISDGLQKDIRNKMNEEIVHHEQMSKRTEKMCTNRAEKLEKEFKKAKNSLTCFINKTIMDDTEDIYNRLKKDISKTLQERTVEVARLTVEQALNKRTKAQFKPTKHIKKCGQLPHLFNLNKLNPICMKNELLVVNTSSLCQTTNVKAISVGEKRIKDSIDEIIDEYLETLNSDYTKMADYAQESAGGSVILERSSSTYAGRAAFLSIFGFTFGKVIKSIRKVIQPGNLPGECWAFKGEKGKVVIRLAKPIMITAVSIEHTSSLLTPDGKIKSAPKNFNVYAVAESPDTPGIELGHFEFKENGNSIQSFHLLKASPVTSYVQFNFLTNQGNEEYTCVYRIRVHGNHFQT